MVMVKGRRGLKIIHTSDVHLGAEHAPEEARRAFRGVIDRTLSEAADLMIIAGDLFDSSRAVRSNLEFALSELARLRIPVVLLPGNHDPCEEDSVYLQTDIQRNCRHVAVIRDAAGEVLRFPELHLVVWGKPVVEHSPSFEPMGGIPARRGDYWHVAVAHGLYAPDLGDIHRSSPITAEAIAGAGWDYISLGHVHPYREVSQGGVTACYSGSPARFGLEGAGQVALVELHPGRGVRVRPLPVEQ